MANTKVTSNVLADDAVTIGKIHTQSDSGGTLGNQDPNDGHALVAKATTDGYYLSWESVGVAGISSSADATAITINSSEQVGIGTTSPNTQLHIYKASTNAHHDHLKLEMAGGWAGSQNQFKNIVWNDGTNNVGGIGMTYDGTTTNMHFHSMYNGGYKSESDELFSILGSGKCGINASAPTQALEVVDSNNYKGIHIRGSVAPCLTFAQSSTTTPTWRVGISGYDGSAFSISTGASVGDKLMIKNTGTVLIGATSLDSPSNAGTLELVGKSTQDGTIRLKADSSKGSEQSHVHYGSNGNWYIRPSNVSSGNVYVRNYQAESDQRLKHNIEDITYGTAEILQLRPRKFSWIGGNTEQNGFVAQEVESVIPAFVRTGELKINEDDEEGIKSVDYNSIVAALVKTIQELEARIQTLESN